MARMHEQLDKLESALLKGNMLLNEGKQQIFGLTKKVRAAWGVGGDNATPTAEDLGVSHYGYGRQHPELDAKISGLRRAAQRIKVTCGAARQRCAMMASVLSGRCHYRSECHYTTETQFKVMRRVICTAMCDVERRRPDGLRLLVCGGGRGSAGQTTGQAMAGRTRRLRGTDGLLG